MLRNRIEREIENAKRQLSLYETQLKEVEAKAIELELKNQQYTQDLTVINKQVNEKEKEVEEMSQRIRDIRLEHGSSDARQIKMLEQRVRYMLAQFFQNCKKHKVRKQTDYGASFQKIENKGSSSKNNNQLEEIQEGGSNADLNNLSTDRKFMNGSGIKSQQKISKLAKPQIQQEISFDFVIKVKNGQQVNDVPIDLSSIQKVSNLRDYLSKTYSIQKEFLFLYDESGNMLLDETELEHSLFPNVFKTIKNYTPQLTIEVKRQKTNKNQGNQNNIMETLVTGNDEQNLDDMSKGGIQKRNLKKKGTSWNNFIQKLPKILKSIQHLFENLAILALIVLFIINRYIGNDIANDLVTMKNNNDNPYFQLSSVAFMFAVIQEMSAVSPSVQFTPFLNSIAVQQRIQKVTTNCIVPAKHKTLFKFGTDQNCVDFDSTDKDPFKTKDKSYYKYSSLPGTNVKGFILKIPSDFDSMTDDQKNSWVDFQTSSVVFYMNFFNAPTMMAAQLKVTITHIVTDGKIQNLSTSINSFSVQPETQSEKIISNFVTGIASFLLLFALIEYIGIYGQNTTNITIQLYKQRKEAYEKIKIQEEIDQKEFEKNFGAAAAQNRKKNESKAGKLEDHQFKIIDLTWLYILIKRPEFFDIINIISLILILVQSGIYSSFRSKREGIIKYKDTEYVHLDDYIQEEFIINMLTAINTLLLMLSFTKYLASWSFTLKIYSQIMTTVNFTITFIEIQTNFIENSMIIESLPFEKTIHYYFVQNSWSQLLIVVAIILTISFSWMTFIDGSIQNHDSFVYSIFLQIKATFYSSFIQDLRLSISNQPEMPPIIKKSVFNPFVVIAMLIIQFVIHFSIFSFLASLMAHSIHVTKERMEKISKEIQDFEKRKVVNSTTFFRKSIQNFAKQEKENAQI